MPCRKGAIGAIFPIKGKSFKKTNIEAFFAFCRLNDSIEPYQGAISGCSKNKQNRV